MTITNSCHSLNDRQYCTQTADMSTDAYLISDSVHIITKLGPIPCSVSLTTKVFAYQPFNANAGSNSKSSEDDIPKTILVDDIIGCVLDETSAESTHNALIDLIAYPVKKNKRRRKSLKFIISKHATVEENKEEAIKWRNIILAINYGVDCRDIKSRKFLFIINPASGKKRAMKIFKRHVKPLLVDSETNYELKITQYPNHALEYVRDIEDISTYYAIVVVSGDGLLHEVVNGLAKRKNVKNSEQMPISLGIIPGGSGNGLAHSINEAYLYNGIKSVDPLFDCTLHATRGKDVAIDLIRVTTPKAIYYSFLSCGWGLMADIDIESERLRAIGEPRFTIWGFYRSIALRKYRARLSYLPADRDSVIPSINSEVPNEWVTIDDDFIQIYSSYQTHISSSVVFAPEAKFDDGIIWLLFIRGNVSRKQVVQFLLALEKGKHTALPYITFVAVKAFRIEPHNNCGRLTIDGELVESSDAQVQVIPRMANMLSR